MGAVIPENGREVVRVRGADEEVEVLPMSGGLDVEIRLPLADEDGDVREVAAEIGEVGLYDGFIVVRAPEGLAPGPKMKS